VAVVKEPIPLEEGESKRGEAPLKVSSPSPSKERGIKGVRSIKTIINWYLPDILSKEKS
jgi:hypothetical protein